jgi:hypothetical protein
VKVIHRGSINDTSKTMPPQLKTEQGGMPPLLDLDALLDSTIRDCETATNDARNLATSSQRSVSFNRDVKIYPVIRRSDMSNDEICHAWMTRYDIKESKRTVHNTIFLMKTGAGAMLTEEDFFCARGLEKCVDEDYSKRVKKSLRIALAMQRVLRRAGKSSPEMIAKAYRSYTLRSRRIAYRKALEDQTAACR